MNVSQQLTNAIAAALSRRSGDSPDSALRVTAIATNDSFLQNHGFAGSEIRGLEATVSSGGAERTARLAVKRWAPHQWVRELTGVTDWLELLLYDSGIIAAINLETGIRVPTIGSVTTDAGEWIIMEDVSAPMASWMRRTEDEAVYFWRPTADCMPLYLGLIDRLARLHALWEKPDRARQLSRISDRLMSQETRLLSLAAVFQDWFDGADGKPSESHADFSSDTDRLLRKTPASTPASTDGTTQSGKTSWQSRAAFADARRGHFTAFLNRLPTSDRRTWIRHMTRRDDLVTAAESVPKTLLHGDINRRNIGVEEGEPGTDYVLIDWEAASYASHALDVVGLISAKAFDPDEVVDLEGHYYDRYRHHGGQALDKETWNRACDIATAHAGLCRLPHIGELVRERGSSEYVARIDAVTDRVSRVLHGLGR